MFLIHLNYLTNFFRKLYKRRGINGYDLALISGITGAGLFLGAHILYGITQFPLLVEVLSHFGDYIKSFSDFTDWFGVIFGGMVFYGGLIGGLLTGICFTKRLNISRGDYLDLFAAATPLFHAFGRIGCFLGGCCFGIESHFGFTYTWSLSEAANGVSRFPVQLLESLLNFILAAVLIYLFG